MSEREREEQEQRRKNEAEKSRREMCQRKCPNCGTRLQAVRIGSQTL